MNCATLAPCLYPNLKGKTMPCFDEKSENNLIGVDARLVLLARLVIVETDHSIIQGYRGKEEQTNAYQARRSRFQWQESKHNKTPTEAIDVCPNPVQRQNVEGFFCLASRYLAYAKVLEIDLAWGGTWDSNGLLLQSRFRSNNHLEIVSDPLR